jgi:hypothetical protein
MTKVVRKHVSWVKHTCDVRIFARIVQGECDDGGSRWIIPIACCFAFPGMDAPAWEKYGQGAKDLLRLPRALRDVRLLPRRLDPSVAARVRRVPAGFCPAAPSG